jgi:hypothetical protein
MATKEPKQVETKSETPEANAIPQLRLKQYTKEELNPVFDTLIFEGEYQEEVTIRGKLKVAFKTRNAEETMAITRMLDSQDFKLLSTVQEQRAYQNILRSLIMYQGKDLSQVKLEDKANYIRKLPTSIMSALADALAEFDRKVDLACRDAEQGF